MILSYRDAKDKKNLNALYPISAFSHTAAFKLGALFDILALYSISRVNL